VQRGYIKIWRKLEDSGLLQMPDTLATMLFLILHATHKATKRGTKYGVVELERGQGILAIRVLAKDMKLSIQSIRTILVRLEKMEILTLKPTHAFSVYTIVNYNKYNDVTEQSTRETTNEQHAANTRVTQEQELKHLRNKQISFSTAFGDFWNAWPSSKRKGAQGKCWEVWKKFNLDTVSQVIISHVEYCKGNGVWKDPDFISAPLVYLNQRKWEGAEIKSGQSELGNFI